MGNEMDGTCVIEASGCVSFDAVNHILKEREKGNRRARVCMFVCSCNLKYLKKKC